MVSPLVEGTKLGEIMKYYAHSKTGEPVENWQPLEEHLANVAEMSAKFAEVFSNPICVFTPISYDGGNQ